MEINIRATPVYVVRSRDDDGHEQFHAVDISATRAVGIAATVIDEFNANYLGQSPVQVEIVNTRFGLIRGGTVDQELSERAYREARAKLIPHRKWQR